MPSVSPRALTLCFALALGGSAPARAEDAPGAEAPDAGSPDAEPPPSDPQAPSPEPQAPPARTPPFPPDQARAAYDAQLLIRRALKPSSDPWLDADWEVVMGSGRRVDTPELAALVNARDLQRKVAAERAGARRARTVLLVVGSSLTAGALLQLATAPLAESEPVREDHLWRAIALGVGGGLAFGASPFPVRAAEQRARHPAATLTAEEADRYLDDYNATLRDWLMLPPDPPPTPAEGP